MPHNLIGLIQASKISASPDQGFKNYVAQAGTGVAMSDYLVGTPMVPAAQMTTDTASAVVGQLSVVSQTPDPVNGEVGAYTNVQYTISYAAGAKASSIYDAALTTSDVINQLKVYGVLVDALAAAPPTNFQWATLRSYSVNTVTKTITAVVTYHQYYDEGSIQGGDSYYTQVPIQFTFQHDAPFNYRAYTTVPTSPNPPGAAKIMTVRPYMIGQPTHLTWGSSTLVLTPSFTFTTDNPYYPSSWIASGVTAQEGSYLYRRVVDGYEASNYFHNGYMLQAQLNGTWLGAFNTLYPDNTGINALNVTYYWEVWNGTAWVRDSTTVRTDVYTIPDPVLLVNWDYASRVNGASPTVASFTVRFGAQITSPFTSPIQWASSTITVPTYSERTASGGGTQA